MNEVTQVRFDSVLATEQSGVMTPLREVVRDDAAWERLRGRLHAAAESAPEVDFGSDMLIAAALGSRPTGGHAVRIAGIAETGGRLVVTVQEVAPGPGCLATQALTSPIIVVRLPRTEAEVEFIVTRLERPCD